MATANDICNDIEPKGSSSSFEIEGEAEAHLLKLFKSIAGLGISGAGSYSVQEYKGLLQENLDRLALANPEIFTAQSSCRQAIFAALKDDMLPGASADTLPPLGEAQYQNAYLRAVAMSASQSKDGRHIVISVTIDNISEQTIYLAYNDAFPERAMGTDDRGQIYREYHMTGLTSEDNPNQLDAHDFAAFHPGSRHTLVHRCQQKIQRNAAPCLRACGMRVTLLSVPVH